MATAMTLKHKIRIRIAKDSDLKFLRHQDPDNESEVSTTTYTKSAKGDFTVEAAAADEALSTGDITAVKGMYLEVDQEVGLKLNGSSDILQLRIANSTTGAKAKFFFEGDVSAVLVVAHATAEANGYVIFWGDAAA